MESFRSIISVVLIVICCCILIHGQGEVSPSLFISESSVKRLTEERPTISVWINAANEQADSVRIEVPFIISSDGERFKLDYEVDPHLANITPGNAGQLFNITFNSFQVGNLETDTYTAVVIVSSTNIPELKENVSFEIIASVSIVSFLNTKLDWVKENIFSLLFSLLEMIGVILIIIILIRVFRNLLGSKKALRILPIVDETGKGSEYGGIASGIDDLLQSRIQDIVNLISRSIVSRSALSGIKTQAGQDIGGRSTSINILKGSEDIDPQKIGDLAVGILKIPLGSLITVISKMFGGTYVTGALQKYASTNKLILTLEQRTFLSLKKKSVVLFEASWHSDNLADGIPAIIEELTYRIIIHLSDEINTNHWKAYKHFLEGNMLFSEYEENESRKDLLRDAIACWRESLRIDPKFAETHYNLGVASDRDNKISDALFRYDRAVEFGTEQTKTKALANMARLYVQDIKDPGIARNLIAKAKKINPSHAELWNLEGLIFLNEQRDTEASGCFQKAIELNKKEVTKNKVKEEPVYQYNLSVANYYLKNYSLAESSGLNAYKLYPETAKPIYLLQTLGLIYNMKGEHEKGLRYFEEGLLKEPENRDMLDGYSTALYHLKRIDESFAVHRRLLRIYPQYYNGYLNITRILEVRGANDAIINCYRDLGNLLRNTDINAALQSIQDKYSSLVKNSIEQNIYAAAIAGIFYYVRRDYDQSETYFKTTVTDVIPEFESLFLPEALLTYGMALIIKNDPEAAVNCFLKAIPLFTVQQYYDLAICYDKLAEAYINVNKHNEADSAYTSSIYYYKELKMTAVASEIYAKRASWLTGLYYFSAAENDCEEAIYLNPLNFNAYHYKGNIRYNSRNDVDAISQYEHSVEIFFDVPGTHYTMGLCHFYLGNYEEAIKKFETTLKLKNDYYSPDDMNNPDAYQRLALSWESIGNYEKAGEILKKAVNLFSKKIKYRLLLAKVYKNLNKFSDAERELNYCLTLYETEPPNFKHLVLSELADIYLDYGVNYETAFNHIEKAIRILEVKKEQVQSDKDELIMLKQTKGWACFKLNKYDEAKELLEETLSSFIGNVKIHSRIAALYQKLSEIDQDDKLKSTYKTRAIEQWRIAADLSADEDRLKKTAVENLNIMIK